MNGIYACESSLNMIQEWEEIQVPRQVLYTSDAHALNQLNIKRMNYLNMSKTQDEMQDDNEGYRHDGVSGESTASEDEGESPFSKANEQGHDICTKDEVRRRLASCHR